MPEWQATLDALQELPEIGADGPVGYFGINMGTAIGVPLVAIEPRITAAVFGQHWPDALAEKAKQITIPIEFDMQWDDEHIPRAAGQIPLGYPTGSSSPVISAPRSGKPEACTRQQRGE